MNEPAENQGSEAPRKERRLNSFSEGISLVKSLFEKYQLEITNPDFAADEHYWFLIYSHYGKALENQLLSFWPIIESGLLTSTFLNQILDSCELAALNFAIDSVQNGEMDPLTKAWKSKSLRSKIEYYQAQSQKDNLKGEQIVLLYFIDLDDFKLVNDNHGHEIGDAVLKNLVQTIKANIRAEDVIVRKGGEEFCVIQLLSLIAIQAAAAKNGVSENEVLKLIAENFRQRITDQLETIVDGKNISPTLSVGVTKIEPEEDPGDAIHRADLNMYVAKNSGKDSSYADWEPKPKFLYFKKLMRKMRTILSGRLN